MPASAIITALMSLENPRTPPGKSTLVILDAGIYYPGDSNPSVAALRYYNKEGHVFNDDGGLYFVVAKVVKMKSGVNVLSKTMQDSEYDLQGDIVQLLPVSGPVKPRPAILQVVASVTDSVNVAEASFEVLPVQWTTADNAGSLPIKAVIAEESKWKKDRTRALPSAQSTVSFLGYLVDIERDEKQEPTRFVVQIERELEFISRPPRTSSSVPGSEERNRTPGRGSKLRFNMGGSTPGPSPVALGKRPMREASLSSTASDDGTFGTPSPAKRPRIEGMENLTSA